MNAWLDVRQLSVRFNASQGGLLRKTQGTVHALSEVDFTLAKGETLGLIGESGSGKSTLGRAVLHLNRPSDGHVLLEGTDLTALSERDMRPFRRRMQMVFQDPFDSMNPRMTVGEIIAEPLRLQRIGSATERRARSAELLSRMGLDPAGIQRYPGQYSGGQRQRIAIARAMILNPRFVVLDEPTSALDRSVQSQVVELLKRLQRERGITYLFISHDLRLVRAMSHEIIVMKDGDIVESGPTEQLISEAKQAYTRELLSAAYVSG